MLLICMFIAMYYWLFIAMSIWLTNSILIAMSQKIFYYSTLLALCQISLPAILVDNLLEYCIFHKRNWQFAFATSSSYVMILSFEKTLKWKWSVEQFLCKRAKKYYFVCQSWEWNLLQYLWDVSFLQSFIVGSVNVSSGNELMIKKTKACI